MQNPNAAARSNRSRWILWAGGAVVTMLALVWMWPDSPVELDDDGYQMAIALYRVCNQRDADGLAGLDGRLRESEASQSLSPKSRQAITSIIATAHAGRWNDAAIACRRALDDQVKR